MLTQIYEVSSPEEARAILRSGSRISAYSSAMASFRASFLWPRRRRWHIAVLPPAKVSTLFLTADMSLIEDWAAQLGASIIHLGAAPELLSPDQTASLKRKLPGRLVMRSIPITGAGALTPSEGG